MPKQPAPDPSEQSDDGLQATLAKARAELVRLQSDPGRGLPPAKAEQAREARIERLRETNATAEALKAELAHRERRSLLDRLRGIGHPRERLNDWQRQQATVRGRAKAEERSFAATINEASRERAKARPTPALPPAPPGGPVVASVLGSAELWHLTQREARPDAPSGPLLRAKDVLNLWWVLNEIARWEGCARVEQGRWPGWPADDFGPDGIRPSRESLAHLARNGYIEIDEEPGVVVYRYGPRTRRLAGLTQPGGSGHLGLRA